MPTDKAKELKELLKNNIYDITADGVHYRYWNYFSAFKVSSIEHIDDVEGILIAAIPLAANSAKPKFNRIQLPRSIKTLVTKLGIISADKLRS